MQIKSMLTRFAPSPTGLLHLGHVLAAKEAFGAAQAAGGTCLLRIEDIDHTRCRPEFTKATANKIWALGDTATNLALARSNFNAPSQSFLSPLNR